MQCVVIKPDGTYERKKLDFEGCQEACGGFIQLVALAPNVWAYVNEDGISAGLPDNDLATNLVVMFGDNVLYDRAIHGTMVVVGPHGNRDAVSNMEAILAKLKKVTRADA